MNTADGFLMVHPQHRPAELRDDIDSGAGGHPGAPELWPPVTVFDANQEEMYRAKGYLKYGEAQPKATDYAEYPLMLWHPQHVEALPPTVSARMDNGQFIQFQVPGSPEKFPPVTVHDPEDEAEWNKKGYARPGHADELAFERATVSPGTPGAEYPRWETRADERGNEYQVLVEDPERPIGDPNEYPKSLNFDDGSYEIAKDAAHESRILTARGSSKNEPVKKPAEPPTPTIAELQAQLAALNARIAMMQPKEVVEAPLIEADIPPHDGEDLRQQAAELGIAVDRRWGHKRMRAEIDAALSK